MKYFVNMILFCVMATAFNATAASFEVKTKTEIQYIDFQFSKDTFVNPDYVLKCEAAFQYINNLYLDDCDTIQRYYQMRLIEKERYISTLERSNNIFNVNYQKLEAEAIRQANTAINNPLYLSIQEENFLVKDKLKTTENKLKKRNRLLLCLSIITSSIIIITTL